MYFNILFCAKLDISIYIMFNMQVQIKELNLPIDDFNGWSGQLIAENDTWSHARRKRRLAQRQMNQSRDHDREDTNTSNDLTKNGSEKLIENNTKDNTTAQKQVQLSAENVDIKEPLLICSFFVELIEHEEPENDDIKISMIFEKGTGGKNALETFKQYLINKLDVREYFQKQCARPNKKKRKRLKSGASNDAGSQESEKSFESSVESV